MSRHKVYMTDRYTVYSGNDMVCGNFVQLYDNQYVNVQPDSDGLVFDWSEKFDVEIDNLPNKNLRIEELKFKDFDQAGDFIFNYITLYTLSLN